MCRELICHPDSQQTKLHDHVWLCPAQVVGRVNKGLDVLELLGDVPCGPDDSPLMRLKVFKCGATNAEVGGALQEAWPEGCLCFALCALHCVLCVVSNGIGAGWRPQFWSAVPSDAAALCLHCGPRGACEVTLNMLLILLLPPLLLPSLPLLLLLLTTGHL